MKPKRSQMFEQINEGYLPVAEGDDVFVSEEYARAVGIGGSTARLRLKSLLETGEVRRVMTKREGGLRRGWQLVRKGK